MTLYGLSEFVLNKANKVVRGDFIAEDTKFFTKKLSFWDKLRLVARHRQGRTFLKQYAKADDEFLGFKTKIQVPTT